jgi:hypothetical protein
MKKRPLSITIIGWLFVVAGTIGLVYHATEFKLGDSFQYDVVMVCLIRVVAIVCGVFVLRGYNWARWGLLAWIAYHVILSIFHSTSQLVTHVLVLAVVGYFLFRPKASTYFQDTGGIQTPQSYR